MYSTRIIYRLAFWVAIVILSIGGYLKYTHQLSRGLQHNRLNNSSRMETIDGNGTLALGFLLLLFALWMYISYQKEKKEREKKKAQENEPYSKNRDWTAPKTHQPL